VLPVDKINSGKALELESVRGLQTAITAPLGAMVESRGATAATFAANVACMCAAPHAVADAHSTNAPCVAKGAPPASGAADQQQVGAAPAHGKARAPATGGA
jgi:hypothetical protein